MTEISMLPAVAVDPFGPASGSASEIVDQTVVEREWSYPMRLAVDVDPC